MFGRLLFFRNTICDVLKPLWFINEFFALIAHANALFLLHLTLSHILTSIVVIRWLCLSRVPLLLGLNDAVPKTFILNFLHKIITCKFTSIVTQKVIWSTKDADPVFLNVFIELSFFLIITALLNVTMCFVQGSEGQQIPFEWILWLWEDPQQVGK